MVPVVEGFGEVAAVPILLRRIAEMVQTGRYVSVLKPIRIKRNQILLPNQLEKYVQLAAAKGGSGARILILLDADDECPAQIAPELLARATAAREDRRIAVLVPTVEFEPGLLQEFVLLLES